MKALRIFLAACLAGCYGEPISTAQPNDGAFVRNDDDAGVNPVRDEVETLPFKHVEWEFKFANLEISRLTMGGGLLFLETPDFEVIAVDRFTGRTSWRYKIDTETMLDWPPVVAQGASEEIRRLEDDLRAVNRQLDDMLKEKGVGLETQKIQKKRAEVREKLKVAAFGDNVFFVSKHILYCVDRLSGSLRWTHRLNFVPSAQPFAIRNYVFVPGMDLARVWVLDVEKKGSEITFYKASLERDNHVMNRAVFADPSVYFVSHDGKVYCYKVTDGTCTWTYPTEREIRADPVIYTYRQTSKDEKGKDKVLSTRILFVGGADKAFYALDADAGAILWKYECGAEFKAPAAARDGTVYVKTEEGALHAFEILPVHRDPKTGASLGPKRNGNLRWKIPLGERFIVKGRERVYVMGPNAEIYAIHEMTGEITGRYPLQLVKHILTNTSDDFLYVAGPDGQVFCLRESKENF